MIPVSILSHFFWTALMFSAFYAVYRKYQENELAMLKNLYRFFLVWSVGFFGPMATLLTAGYYLDSPLMMSLGYVLPHFFAFLSVGYLWKTLTSIYFPKYSRLFWAFVGYGAGVVVYGLSAMPKVAVVDGHMTYGNTLMQMLIPLGMTVSAALIAGSSFYAAYMTRGETRRKLSLLGVGTVLSLVVASILNNMGHEVIGQVVNLIWIAVFLAVAYWDRLTG